MDDISTSSNSTQSQGSQNILTIVISIIATAIFVGGGLYLLINRQIDDLRQEIQNLQSQNAGIEMEMKDLEKDLEDTMMNTEIDENKKIEDKVVSNLCTDAPIPTEIGLEIYPIDPKYNELNFLGQLFTAYDCGPSRLSNLWGVSGNEYSLGSSIWLKSNPSQSLVITFTSIGFICGDKTTDDNCKKWELSNTIEINELMKIEAYYEEFRLDDCIHCG